MLDRASEEGDRRPGPRSTDATRAEERPSTTLRDSSGASHRRRGRRSQTYPAPLSRPIAAGRFARQPQLRSSRASERLPVVLALQIASSRPSVSVLRLGRRTCPRGEAKGCGSFRQREEEEPTVEHDVRPARKARARPASSRRRSPAVPGLDEVDDRVVRTESRPRTEVDRGRFGQLDGHNLSNLPCRGMSRRRRRFRGTGYGMRLTPPAADRALRQRRRGGPRHPPSLSLSWSVDRAASTRARCRCGLPRRKPERHRASPLAPHARHIKPRIRRRRLTRAARMRLGCGRGSGRGGVDPRPRRGRRGDGTAATGGPARRLPGRRSRRSRHPAPEEGSGRSHMDELRRRSFQPQDASHGASDWLQERWGRYRGHLRLGILARRDPESHLSPHGHT